MKQKTLIQLAIKSFQNAKELHCEAALLFKNKHYARSMFLSQIGGEELGKHVMCISAYASLLLENFNEDEEKRFTKRFRDHREKTKSICSFERFSLGLLKTEDDLLGEEVNANIFEKGKLASLYVDFIEEFAIQPSELVSEDVARETQQLLLNRINHIEKLGIIDMLLRGGIKDPGSLRSVMNEFTKESPANS